jgi:hypothetical protein
MSHLYRSVFPLTQQLYYTQNQTNKFVLSTEGQSILPGSVRITGKCSIQQGVAVPPATIGVITNQQIYYDPLVGYHGLFAKIESGTRAQSTVETLTYYPRLVKTKAAGRSYNVSLGVDSFNSIEGRAVSTKQVQGLIQGLGTTDDASVADTFIPFSIVPDIWLNKLDSALPGSRIGNEVIIQFTMSPNQQFLYGAGVDATATYQVSDLKVQWEAIPETPNGNKNPINYEKYVDDRQLMNSGVTSINVVAPGVLVDSVHMSFIDSALEFTTTSNFLQCAAPPGKAPFVPVGPQVGSNTMRDYGLERIIWSINNSDTSVSGFVQDNREEILWNGLRSLNLEPTAWDSQLENPYMPDLYLAGIPFGGLQDLMSKRFAVQLYSQCTNATVFVCYMFFRATGAI